MVKEIYYKNVQIILLEDEKTNTWEAAFDVNGTAKRFSNWPGKESLIRYIRKKIDEHMGLSLVAVTPGGNCVLCGKLGNFVMLGKHICSGCFKIIKEG